MENYLRWSEDFKNWINGWSKNSEQGYEYNSAYLTVGTKVTETKTFAPHYLLSEFMELPLGWYTFAIWAKAGERKYMRLKSSNSKICNIDWVFNVEADQVLENADTHVQVEMENDWYKCAVSGEVLDNRMFRLQIMILNDDQEWEYAGTEDAGIYIWGAQFNDADSEAANANYIDYIPTYGSREESSTEEVDSIPDPEPIPDPPDEGGGGGLEVR